MKVARTFSLLLFLFAANLFAQSPQGQGPGNQFGPWNRDLEAYESQDGQWFKPAGTVVERGGVPSLVRAPDGKIFLVFQWFPLDWQEAFDQIGVSVSPDDGHKWSEPEPISISGMTEELYRAFDPTLTVLPDGRFRLYFTSERISEENRRGNRAIFSASSEDGINFEFEPGERFGFPGKETYDVAIAYFKGKWHLYCPVSMEEGAAYHAVSDDGLHFTQLANVSVPGPYTWIGNVIEYQGKLRFYGSSPKGVWLAVSEDGENWTLNKNFGIPGGDPAVIVRKSGGFLVVVTGGLRSDAFEGDPFQTP